MWVISYSTSDVYQKEPPVKKSTSQVKVEMIPNDVAMRLMQNSSFIEDIQKESILRFNDVVQKNTQMIREELLPEIITK